MPSRGRLFLPLQRAVRAAGCLGRFKELDPTLQTLLGRELAQGGAAPIRCQLRALHASHANDDTENSNNTGYASVIGL